MPINTWEQAGIWLVTQFPVLFAVALITRWVLRLEKERQAELLKREDEFRQKLVAEKDARIAELKGQVDELKAKLTRARNRGPDGGRPK